MFNHSSLPIVIAALLLAGCAENQVCRDGSSGTSHGNGSFAKPVYFCDGIQYYSVGGRYCYFKENQTNYISSLPPGGHYYHSNYSAPGTSDTYYPNHRDTAYFAPLHSNPSPELVPAPQIKYVTPVYRHRAPQTVAESPWMQQYPRGD